MNKFFISICVFLALITFTRCQQSNRDLDIKKPQFPKIEVPDFSKMRVVCSKEESQQNFSPEALAHRILIEDEVPNRHFQHLNCAGQVKYQWHGPIRDVTKVMTLWPTKSLANQVRFVEVENQRTCATIRINTEKDLHVKDFLDTFKTQDPQKDFYLQNGIKHPNGAVLELESIVSRADRSGAIRLVVTDWVTELQSQLNITDGANVIQIRYFGKCLEYKIDSDEKLGDAENCLKAQLLSTYDFIIDLKVHRPEVPGVISHTDHFENCKDKGEAQ